MRPRPKNIQTLRDAVKARLSLWVLCLDCGHAARMDPWWLAQKAGDGKLDDLGMKLKCRRCGARGRGHLVPTEKQGAEL